jgi:hypothetical protein
LISKILSFFAAVAAMMAAAAVLVVSAAFAVYALLRTYIGPAGSAACVTLFAACVLGLLGLFLVSRLKGPKPSKRKKDGPEGLVERITALVTERPAVAASAAAAAGLLAWRNPTLVSTLLRMMEPRAEKRRG